MIIKSIHLTHFRNYGRLDLDVGPSVNIFYGNNAQGKTNIIEAIYVAGSVTSHRTSKDSEMIKFGENEYKTSLELLTDDGGTLYLDAEFITEKSEFSSNSKSSRVLKQDGIRIDKISDYIGVCNTVIFAPEDLNIVKNAPSFRRKFLNMLISKVSPSYFNLLTRLSKLINQKNVYLKKVRFSDSSDKASVDRNIDFWDFSIADLSADMIMMRARFVKLLSEASAKYHSNISGGLENLSIGYETITGCNSALEAFLNENSIVDEFITKGLSGANYERIKGILSTQVLNKLKSVRNYDIEKGVSSVGINKDDLDIKLDGLQMRSYSSQGQQRSAALSLKLAELDILRRFTSSAPILLLDDVFSELDGSRRVSLISAMKDAQIFITCTDKAMTSGELSLMEDLGNARYFRVENGQVTAD